MEGSVPKMIEKTKLSMSVWIFNEMEGGGRILSSLREFALCIRVSSFFPARVTGLRAGKNVTISVPRRAHSAHSAHSARQQITVFSWRVASQQCHLFKEKLVFSWRVASQKCHFFKEKLFFS